MSIRRHAAINFVGQVVPLVAALLSIPFYLQIYGDVRYGVMAVVWLLIGYFGLFDLGLSQATAQRLARVASADHGAAATVLWTALSLSACLGLLGGLVAWAVASLYITHGLGLDTALLGEINAALPWVALAIPTVTLSGVLFGALQASERFVALNSVQVATGLLVQFLPLVGAWWWGALLDVALPAVVLSRVAALGLLVLLQMGRGRPALQGRWSRHEAVQLLGFGGWVTLSSVVGPMMVVLDRFLIGTFAGARAVSAYTIPFQLAERVTLPASALSQALFPRLAGAVNSQARIAASTSALVTLARLSAPLVALSMLGAEPFLRWWLSDALGLSAAQAARWLLLGFWFNGLALVWHTCLQAAGRPALIAKCHLLELLPYLAALYLAIQSGGAVAAAVVFCARAGADLLMLAACGGGLGRSIVALAAPTAWLLLNLAAASQAANAGALGLALATATSLATLAWALNGARGAWRLALRGLPGPVDKDAQ